MSCSTSLWCVRRINVRACRPLCFQCSETKREKKRRWHNSVAGSSKIQSFFVTTTTGKAAEPAAAEPAPRGQVVQELDLTLGNPTLRALFQLGTLPSERRSEILHHGPRRPKGPFPTCSENGNRRIFSETHYPAHSGAIDIKRQWLCFSATTKKPSCQSCWLLGDPSAIQNYCANGVSGKPNNVGVKMKSISHDVGLLGHRCPSMVRYQLIMFLSQFNKRRRA